MHDNLMVVNFEAMQHGVTSIDRALSTMTARMKETEETGKNLTAAWQGTAATNYGSRHEAWTRAAENLENTLRDIKRALQDSIERYIEAEKKNAGNFNQAS
jgi:early secretory antigenic target protein ESAT-6